MTLSGGLIAFVALSYMALLFAIAFYGDRNRNAMSPRMRSWVYSLSLAVYCTSWTFYGTVTQAQRSGWPIPPTFLGTILLYVFGFGFLPTLHHTKTDAESLKPAKDFKPIEYPKPDGVISFDKLTNVSFTNTYHGEEQPVHLIVANMALQKSSEHDVYAGPSARYCPAGVYEWVGSGADPKFQINSQNCIHCKTCDIKDPNQNINWTTPQGGDGPNYPNM